MRNYIPKKNNPYSMPHDTYMMMYYMIRSYRKISEQREMLLYGSPPPPNGMPRSGTTSDPTADKAVVLSTLGGQIHAVVQVVAELRAKYQNTCTGEPFDPYEAFMDYGVFCYYRSSPNKDMSPSVRTWHRYRSEFAYNLAKKLNYF